MKTRARRFGTLVTARLNHVRASPQSTTRAFKVTNSVAGLPGTRAGHCTSPIRRVPSGGIETVMFAKDKAVPRAPENISEGSAALRVVATNISTLLVPGAVVATGTRTPRKVEHPPRASATTRHRQTGKEPVVMGAIP